MKNDNPANMRVVCVENSTSPCQTGFASWCLTKYLVWDKKRYDHVRSDPFELIPVSHLALPVDTIQSSQELDYYSRHQTKLFFTDIAPSPKKLAELRPYEALWLEYNTPLGFWETYQGSGTTTVSLLLAQSQSFYDTQCISQVKSPIDKESVHQTACNAAWDSVNLLKNSMMRLNSKHSLKIKRKNIRSFDVLLLVIFIIFRKITKYNRFFVQHWQIYFVSSLQKNTKLHPIQSPQGTFWADPYPVHHKGETYIFFESYVYAKSRGSLSVGLWKQGTIKEVRTVLQKNFHLSHPFVFQEGSDFYMIPEQAASKELALYRAIKFPDQWKPVTTILKGYYVDPVIIKHENRFYLFATPKIVPGGTSVTHTELWMSSSLTSEWHMHPQSPIISDCRYGRSAGFPFQKGDVWIRPVQDASNGYGHCVHFLKITELTPTTYHHEIYHGTCLQGLEGFHTTNRLEKGWIIDGRTQRWRKKV